jgi:hypothetical protein
VCYSNCDIAVGTVVFLFINFSFKNSHFLWNICKQRYPFYADCVKLEQGEICCFGFNF